MDITASDPDVANLAIGLWHAGVDAVRGEAATRRALSEASYAPMDAVLAVGKAAADMVSGALPLLPAHSRILLLTKYGHTPAHLGEDHRITIIESGHPMPDENSLAAGQAALDFITSCDAEARLLVLVSGGASSLVESLREGFDLDTLRRISTTLLADGYSIDQINHIRIAISRIKGGKLLRRFPGREVLALGISDIPGDDADLIGSGIGAIRPPQVQPFAIPDWISELMQQGTDAADPDSSKTLSFRFHNRLIGSNTLARQAAAVAARDSGLPIVESEELLSHDIDQLAPALADRIRRGPAGIYLWGGEPTVQLPEHPGEGGRNQSLALALTLELGEQDAITGIVAGTDGTDGPTQAAGGIVGPAVDSTAARHALETADAGPWLRRHERLFTTGPTGTNVMDLAVMIKRN